LPYTIRKIDLKTKKQGMAEFGLIGATVHGQHIMVNKVFPLALKVKGIKARAADILKQEMLSRMGDVVTSRDSLIQMEGLTDVIILGTEKSILSLAEKIKMQPFGLKKLSDDITAYLLQLSQFKIQKTLSIGAKEFDLEKEGALIMGILNITPDSFYDGGNYFTEKQYRARIDEIISQGAHIIDVGGMSTRPGSKPVSTREEIERIIPAIKAITKNYDIIISVDTYRSEVASQSVAAGASLINDISGFTMDDKMVQVVASSGASAVIMHMQGTPENMQEDPQYIDVIDDIYNFLYDQAETAKAAGVDPDRIIIDPGIGFGKKLQHNLEIISRLSDFTGMGYPVMVGASRKSFIGNILGGAPATERLEGSIAAAVYAYINGASILRVHDVGATVSAIKVAKSIKDTI
jgi:dihydropteroate synthase